LFDHVGLDLHDAVVRASVALAERPLATRFEHLETPRAGGVGVRR